METNLSYLRDLSLLLSLVYYFQSATMILDRSLPHFVSALISFVSATSLCHIFFNRLKLGNIFDSDYFGAFNLAFAYMITTDEGTNRSLWHGRAMLIAGLSFLAIYFITVKIQGYFYAPKAEPEANPGKPVTPVLVEISFTFLGNGIATLGRGLIPEQNLIWAVTGAAVMLLMSLMFFICFVRCSFKIESQIHAHTE